MSTEADIESQAPAQAAPAPAPNPLLLGLMVFIPAGITLGLWLVGYLDTVALGGGMIPVVSLCAGVFMLVATAWAARAAANTVAAVFGVFSGFWLSFGFLLIGLTSGWWGIAVEGDTAKTMANVASVQGTYLLSFTIIFIIVTLATLRLPLVFTVGFVVVDVTFILVFIAVTGGAAGLFPIAGITTFIFTAIFAYILIDGIGQDLGGRAMPLGNPIQK